jgi:hypothetical protein
MHLIYGCILLCARMCPRLTSRHSFISHDVPTCTTKAHLPCHRSDHDDANLSEGCKHRHDSKDTIIRYTWNAGMHAERHHRHRCTSLNITYVQRHFIIRNITFLASLRSSLVWLNSQLCFLSKIIPWPMSVKGKDADATARTRIGCNITSLSHLR